MESRPAPFAGRCFSCRLLVRKPWPPAKTLHGASALRIEARNDPSLRTGATIMSDEQKNPVSPAIAALHPEERGAYKLLLLSNANYFGNLAESPDKAVVPIVSNTSYEELACVGYHPQQERLEAVVYLYQPTGYGTDLCGAGTPEYVRFYLSFDNGATWQDEGAAGFQAHDIPGTDKAKRLEFAVSLAVSPARKLCWLDSVIQVRAILAWNHLPPANTPGWKPVWGNVREATIQVEPLRLPPLSQVLAEVGQAKLAQLGEVLDLAAPVATQTKALG